LLRPREITSNQSPAHKLRYWEMQIAAKAGSPIATMSAPAAHHHHDHHHASPRATGGGGHPGLSPLHGGLGGLSPMRGSNRGSPRHHRGNLSPSLPSYASGLNHHRHMHQGQGQDQTQVQVQVQVQDQARTMAQRAITPDPGTTMTMGTTMGGLGGLPPSSSPSRRRQQPILGGGRPGPAPPSEWPSPRSHAPSPEWPSPQKFYDSHMHLPPSSGASASTATVSPAPPTFAGAGGGATSPFTLSSPTTSSTTTTSAPPPAGPEPLLLSRSEADELYEVLRAVLDGLDRLGMPHVLIGSTLLGSVRSKSLVFHDDRVEVAILDDEEVSSAGVADSIGGGGQAAAGRVGRHERLVRDLPVLLGRAARDRSDAESGGVEYEYRIRSQLPDSGGAAAVCDRVVSSRAPRVGVDVYVLRKYRTANDLLRLLSVSSNGRSAQPSGSIERILSEIESSAAATLSSGTAIPPQQQSIFPLYHFDTPLAVSLRPREYFLPSEMLPLRRDRYDLGPVRGASGPHFPVRALRRFFGDDCFTHYRLPLSPQSLGRRGGTDQGAATRRSMEEKKLPLSDEHYVPLQHSDPSRRVLYHHGRRELEQFLSGCEGWYLASADASDGSSDGSGHGAKGAGPPIPDMDAPRPLQPRLQRALPSLHRHSSRKIFGDVTMSSHSPQPAQQQQQQQPLQAQPHPQPQLQAQQQPQPQLFAPPQQQSLHRYSTDSGIDSSSGSNTSSGFRDAARSSSFGASIRRHTSSSPDVPDFSDHALRDEVMEPYVSIARAERQRAKDRVLARAGRAGQPTVYARVPYPKLRSERPFLFDPTTHPLHKVLADTIGVDDLSLLHEHPLQDLRVLFDALRHRHTRMAFHECYDNFVTGFCIPLLHSLAMTQGTFETNARTNGVGHRRTTSAGGRGIGQGRANGVQVRGTNDPDAILYRYQAFPSIRVLRPGESSTSHSSRRSSRSAFAPSAAAGGADGDDPHCDLSRGHSVGNISFHVPLTPAFGTNALYAESHPGREDWHPLSTKSLGLGYVYDGARCVHFGLENTTDRTSVCLSFRIAVARCSSSSSSSALGGGGRGRSRSPPNGTHDVPMRSSSSSSDDDDLRDAAYSDDDDEMYVDDDLCSERMLRDAYSAAGPGYYDEAVIDSGAGGGAGRPGRGGGWAGAPVVVKKYGTRGHRHHRLLDPDERVGFPFA